MSFLEKIQAKPFIKRLIEIEKKYKSSTSMYTYLIGYLYKINPKIGEKFDKNFYGRQQILENTPSLEIKAWNVYNWMQHDALTFEIRSLRSQKVYYESQSDSSWFKKRDLKFLK